MVVGLRDIKFFLLIDFALICDEDPVIHSYIHANTMIQILSLHNIAFNSQLRIRLFF